MENNEKKLQVASQQYIDQKFEQMEQSLSDKMEQLIRQANKPAMMTTDEVAEQLQCCNRVARERMKQMYQDGRIKNVEFDSNPLKVNRKEFMDAINQQ